MKHISFVCLFLCLTTIFLLSQSNFIPAPISASQADPKAQAKILDTYGKLPLNFEANHGQTDARVKFLSRTGGYSLFLTGDEAVLALSGKKASPNKAKVVGAARPPQSSMAAPKGGVLRMKLRNANPAAKVTGVDELAGTSNYFIGNDPAKWRSNVPTYAKVKYESIYSGIDLIYYGNQRQLEYDFVVAPGADPHRIQFEVRGAKRILQDAQGELVFKVDEDEIRWHKPVVHQEKNGARQLIEAGYAITNTNRVAFELAKYDVSRPLYIDPLLYSTYLGGSGYDTGLGIAVDSLGNAYITGYTVSADFPVSPGAFQTVCNGGTNCATYDDAFVTKLNSAGSALVYSTYLGGTGYDYGSGIAVNQAGNAYVIGTTSSTDFPTMNPLQPAFGGGTDAFVVELNPAGSALVYSTYLGGSGQDIGYGIAVDSAGNVYVTGSTDSTDFPTMNPLQPINGGGQDAFVSMLNPSGSALVYSTYLGGKYGYGRAIALDSVGNAYVTGWAGDGFPVTPGAFQTGCPDSSCEEAFVTKLNSSGSALVYSTYLGGNSFNIGYGIAVDSAGNAYVTGLTRATDFPTMNPLQPAFGGGKYDGFVTKLNSSGSALIYSTYLGGSSTDWGNGIAVDSVGNAYVTGQTTSQNFPTESPLQKYKYGRGDAFAAKLNPTGSVLVCSTYLGGSGPDTGYGIAVDSSGNAYVVGQTASTNFPTKNPLQPANAGYVDAFVTKIDLRPVATITLSSSLNPSTYGQIVTFVSTVTSSVGAPPNGETISFMKGKTVLGTGSLSGGSTSFPTSTLTVGTTLVTAVYGGDSNFVGSTSTTVKQVVSKATTTTTLTSSLNPSNAGQSLTFTANVTPQFSGTVTGTVTFYDGTTALKTAGMNRGVARFTTSTLASGTHTITATYNGSTSFIGSSASLTQTVN